MIKTISEDLRLLHKYRYVISSYVSIHLRMRYRRSFLGFIWTVLAPLLQYAVIAVVFLYALKYNAQNFFSNFITGSVIFNFISVTLQRAPNVMLQNENYIKKIYLPKSIFVINVCAYELTNLILTSSTLFVVSLLAGKIALSWSLLSLPFCFIPLVLCVFGLSLFLSIAGVFFRDVSYIVPQIMQAMFFLTPIVYTMDSLPPRFQNLISFNLFYHLVEIFRAPIVSQSLAAQEHYIYASLFSFLIFIIGYISLKKYENKIVFRL
jgi:ABC-type polysaccharide/polyol phosphate export permease